jgi:sporulation protein YlmC with PRC-barrel domain
MYMKTKTKFLLAGVLAGAFCIAGVSYGKSKNPIGSETPAEKTTQKSQSPEAAKSASRVEKATELIGREVRNHEGVLLGHVKELAIHLETGEVAEVLLSNPGYVGTSDTLIGVGPSMLQYDPEAKVMRMDSTQEKMAQEPRFETWQWIAFTQSNRLDEVYRYQGGRAFRNTRTEDRVPWGLWRHVNEDTNSRATIAGTRRMIPSPHWAAYLGYLHRATELMGTTVRNPQHEKIGTINDLMIDLSAGRVAATIVSSGEYIRMSDEFSPVPCQALLDRRGYPLRTNPDRPGVLFPTSTPVLPERLVVLDQSREAMEKAPHFSPVSWPDFSQQEYLDELNRAYGVNRNPVVALSGLP